MTALGLKCFGVLTVCVMVHATAFSAAARSADPSPAPACGVPDESTAELEDRSCKRPPGARRPVWRLAAVSPDLRVFVSPDTVRVAERGLRSAWLLWSHEQPQKVQGGPAYAAVKELAVFDCKSRSIAGKLQIYLAQATGTGAQVHRSETADAQLEYIEYAPGTVGAAVLAVTCALGRR